MIGDEGPAQLGFEPQYHPVKGATTLPTGLTRLAQKHIRTQKKPLSINRNHIKQKIQKSKITAKAYVKNSIHMCPVDRL